MIHLTDLEPVACRPDTEIAEVLKRLSASSYLFLLVVDESGQLLGTITDGDARRAFLRGLKLNESASSCMQANPIVGRVGDEDENRRKLGEVKARSAFLPVLDDSGSVREVLFASQEADHVVALVMAGGPGKRLGELTQAIPKPLLPVGDKPILEHILKRLEEAGLRKVFISVHYLPEQIEAFVAERDSIAEIELLHETSRLGTAGALSQLPASDNKEVLVINGDILTDVNFGALEHFHQRQAHDATITVANYEVHVPYGIVRHSEDGLFVGIDEKPKQSHLAAAGIYLLSPQFAALVPSDRPMDMPELLNLGRSIGLRVGLFPIHEYWVDVGRVDDLEGAIRDHANSKKTPAPLDENRR